MEKNLAILEAVRRDGMLNRQTVLFSDSIVISIRYVDNGSLLQMLLAVWSLLRAAADEGFLLRGGITRGNMFHDEKMAFGPAFIRSYRLEQKAIYPRVILEENLVENFYDIEGKIKQDYITEEYIAGIGTLLKKDIDGCFYVSFLDTAIFSHTLQSLKEITEKHKFSTDIKIREKYEWLEDKLKKFEIVSNLYSSLEEKTEHG